MTDSEASFDNTPVEALALSMKALGYLKRTQIYAIGDLLNYTQEDLLLLDPELGAEVLTALQEKFGLTLPINDQQ